MFERKESEFISIKMCREYCNWYKKKMKKVHRTKVFSSGHETAYVKRGLVWFGERVM